MLTPNKAAEEANARLARQKDLYQFGGGKAMDKIHMEIQEIRESVQEVTVLLRRLIELMARDGQ